MIQNGTTKLVNVKNQDSVTKILDMVPDFVNKFAAGRNAGAAAPQQNPDVDEAIHNAAAEEKTF